MWITGKPRQVGFVLAGVAAIGGGCASGTSRLFIEGAIQVPTTVGEVRVTSQTCRPEIREPLDPANAAREAANAVQPGPDPSGAIFFPVMQLIAAAVGGAMGTADETTQAGVSTLAAAIVRTEVAQQVGGGLADHIKSSGSGGPSTLHLTVRVALQELTRPDHELRESGNPVINPPLILRYVLVITAGTTNQTNEFGVMVVRYESPARRFSAWTANDARLIAAETANAVRDLLDAAKTNTVRTSRPDSEPL